MQFLPFLYTVFAFLSDEYNGFSDTSQNEVPTIEYGDQVLRTDITGPFRYERSSYSAAGKVDKPIFTATSLNELSTPTIFWAFYAVKSSDIMSFEYSECHGSSPPLDCFLTCLPNYAASGLFLSFDEPNELIIGRGGTILLRVANVIFRNQWNLLAVSISRYDKTVHIYNNNTLMQRFEKQSWTSTINFAFYQLQAGISCNSDRKFSPQNAISCIGLMDEQTTGVSQVFEFFEACRSFQRGRLERPSLESFPFLSNLASLFLLDKNFGLTNVAIAESSPIVKSVDAVLNLKSRGIFGENGTSYSVSNTNSLFSFPVNFRKNWTGFTLSFAFYAKTSPAIILAFSATKCTALTLSYAESAYLVISAFNKREIERHAVIQPNRWNSLTLSFRNPDGDGSLAIFGHEGVLIVDWHAFNMDELLNFDGIFVGHDCLSSFSPQNAISCIAFYNATLTDSAEVAQIYHGCKNVQVGIGHGSIDGNLWDFDKNLIGFWPLDSFVKFQDIGPHNFSADSATGSSTTEFGHAFSDGQSAYTSLNLSILMKIDRLISFTVFMALFPSKNASIAVLSFTSTKSQWPCFGALTFVLSPPSTLFLHHSLEGTLAQFQNVYAPGVWNMLAFAYDAEMERFYVIGSDAVLVDGERVPSIGAIVAETDAFIIGDSCDDSVCRMPGFPDTAAMSCFMLFNSSIAKRDVAQIINRCSKYFEQLEVFGVDVDAGSSNWIVAVVTAAIVTAVASIFATFSLREKQKQKQKLRSLLRTSVDTGQFWQRFPAGVVATLNEIEKLQIDPKNLEFLDSKLGEGLMGFVEAAIYKCDQCSDGLNVAVKRLKHGCGPLYIEFYQEALLMAGLDHQNVLNLIGIATFDNEPMLVIPLMERGCLRDDLRQNGFSFDAARLFGFVRQICCGMVYLASKNVVHRDLASRNVLVSEDFVAKICDFGLAKKLDTENVYTMSSRDTPQPIRWLPPESFVSQKFESKSDVWSFGVLVWEIYSLGTMPYQDLENMDVMAYVRCGKRLGLTQRFPPEMYNYIRDKCWTADVAARANFDDIEAFLSLQATRL